MNKRTDRRPPPPSGCACHLPLAGEDRTGCNDSGRTFTPAILPRQGEVAPQATEGEAAMDLERPGIEPHRRNSPPSFEFLTANSSPV